MVRSLLIICTLLVTLFESGSAQDLRLFDSLEFGKTTTAELISAKGKPRKTRYENPKRLLPDGSYSRGTRIEFLEYRKLSNWKKVEFGFVDGKLISIEYLPTNKTLEASKLPELFDRDFVSVEGFSKSVSLSVFEGQKEPTVPKVYAPIYFMVSATPETVIISMVNNGSWKAMFKDSFNLPTVKTFPGFIENIKLVQRKPE